MSDFNSLSGFGCGNETKVMVAAIEEGPDLI
jgi:hypothetical protein